MSQFRLYLRESGTVSLNSHNSRKVHVSASIDMTLPFVPFVGLILIPPSPDAEEKNEEWVVKEVVWDGDNNEFVFEQSYEGPDEIGPDEDTYTLGDWVQNKRQNGWKVELSLWTFHEDRALETKDIDLADLPPLYQEQLQCDDVTS